MTTHPVDLEAASRPPAQRPTWRPCTVRAIGMETRDARTLHLDVDGGLSHVAGQHVDLRLTAANGYTAERSYSVASAAGDGDASVTVQRVSGGEVSSYLVDVLQVGDQFEIRGPVGGWFVWDVAVAAPLVLVAGGSGIVPLMSMVRTRARSSSRSRFHLIYASRTPDHLFYANELHALETSSPWLTIERAFSRGGLPGEKRVVGRLRPADIPAVNSWGLKEPRAYVCGPSAFVEHAAGLLQQRGFMTHQIRTERFG